MKNMAIKIKEKKKEKELVKTYHCETLEIKNWEKYTINQNQEGKITYDKLPKWLQEAKEHNGQNEFEPKRKEFSEKLKSFHQISIKP